MTRIDAAKFVQSEHARALAVMRLVYGLTDDEIISRLEAPPATEEPEHDPPSNE